MTQLARQYLDYGRAKRKFARTHPGGLRWRQLAAPLVTSVLGASLVVSMWLPAALAIPAAYLLGLVIVGTFTGANPLRVSAALATMHLSWGYGFLTTRDGVER